MRPSDPGAPGPRFSVVVPMYNEADNAKSLITEIAEALTAQGDFEIIAVDDCSKDKTANILLALKPDISQLRVIQHSTNAGQSRAVRTGILAAKGAIIGTLDGDGQNNPADLPRLYKQLTREDAPQLLALVAGERQKRQDSQAKKIASKLANNIRKSLLGDDANDTGCGLKVFYKEAFIRLPYFDHIHRYLPALMKREAFLVEFCPVSHRPRLHGESKYTNFGRAAVAIRDLLGVIWLKARARDPQDVSEL
ncbi:MAG: glycosyltransferase family 2 protein [bacterium]